MTDVAEDNPSCMIHKTLPFVLFTLYINHDSTWTLMAGDSKVRHSIPTSLLSFLMFLLMECSRCLELALEVWYEQILQEVTVLEVATASEGVHGQVF